MKLVARTRLLRWFNGGSDRDDAVLLPLLLLKVRSVRMLDMIVCSEPLVWLFSPAWDAGILTLDAGLICPFVVIEPADFGATTVVAPGRTIDTYPQRRIPAFVPYGIKASLCVCAESEEGV